MSIANRKANDLGGFALDLANALDEEVNFAKGIEAACYGVRECDRGIRWPDCARWRAR